MKIFMRDKRWEEERYTKRMLKSLQDLMRLRDLVDTDAFDPLIYFVLSLFPIEDTSQIDGNVTEEYEDFVEEITEYQVQELYDKLMMIRSEEE